MELKQSATLFSRNFKPLIEFILKLEYAGGNRFARLLLYTNNGGFT